MSSVALGPELFEGCYSAQRAAALAGVPTSTVYLWARNDLVPPSVSQQRVKLWSYADLMALRITYWLRQPKGGGEVPATPMPEVRRALAHLRELGHDLWTAIEAEDDAALVVDRTGRLYLRDADAIRDLAGRYLLPTVLHPLRPFDGEWGRAPDLVRPRPRLRIIPGKVSGEPHLAGTRVTSSALAALHLRGFEVREISEMYPDEDPGAIGEAIDLEQSLAAAS